MNGLWFTRLQIILLFWLGGGCLYAQHDVKQSRKAPGAYISIAFLDVMSKSIGFYDLVSLEKSCYALGDKSVAYEGVINSFIYGNNAVTDLVQIKDTAYILKLKDCPHIAAYRPADPGLVVMGVFLYRVLNNPAGREKATEDYVAWQMKNVPHSPLGTNNPPDNYTEDQRLRWMHLQVKKWVETYPREYKTMLQTFDSCYMQWLTTKPAGTYAQFVDQYSQLYYRNTSNPVERVLNAPATGIKSSGNKLELPDDETMRHDPAAFVNNVYETLYLRTPTGDEVKFLVKFINERKSLTVKQFYYAMMTSDEYKYY